MKHVLEELLFDVIEVIHYLIHSGVVVLSSFDPLAEGQASLSALHRPHEAIHDVRHPYHVGV